MQVVSVAEYEVDGVRFKVVRHFVGNADLNKVVEEVAVLCTDREAGLVSQPGTAFFDRNF